MGPAGMSDDVFHWKGPIDFCTLVLIVAGGFQLGLQGLFEFDFTGWLFGSWQKGLYDLIGFAAVWQLWRQRFFG
jgi:uncharacterized membrane protein YuzA (DUF378 family)